MVGALRNKEQLEINLKHNFYHTAKSNANLTKNKVEYIAIFMSKSIFKEEAGITYYGKVKEILEVKRSDIKEIPKAGEEAYYKFIVEEWLQLPQKIKVKNFGISKVIYTTEYLLKNSETITELLIKEKEEFRIWVELKRAFMKIETTVNSKTISGDTSIQLIKIGDTDLILEKDKIRILKDDKIEIIQSKDFMDNIKVYIRKLINT